MSNSSSTGDPEAFTRFVAHREDTQLPYLRIVEDEHADTVKMPRCWLLDAPSDPNPLLDALMSEALTRLYLTADGATGKLVERISGGSSTSTAPVSGNWSDVGEIERAYRSSRTHRRRLALIKEAQVMVYKVQYAQKADASLVRGTRDWREKIAHDPRPQRVVTQDYKVSSKTVSAARKEFGVTRQRVAA